MPRVCPAVDHPQIRPGLDWCMYCGYDPNCPHPALLVAMGCADENEEARLKAEEESR